MQGLTTFSLGATTYWFPMNFQVTQAFLYDSSDSNSIT